MYNNNFKNNNSGLLGWFFLAVFCVGGCGVCNAYCLNTYSQRNNETVAYVKHVTNATPMLCGPRVDAVLDMRTPGTMTSETLRFTVANQKDAETLRDANLKGLKVKVISDERRMAFCGEEDVVTSVEVLADQSVVASPTLAK